jgi:hypothetical protein
MDILINLSAYSYYEAEHMTDLAKKENKRWGKKFVDKRDWKIYNGQLVKRGVFFLDLDWVKDWDEELARMNDGKVGAPYEFPASLIKLQSIWHDKNIPYRMIEGMTKNLVALADLPDYNDHSTINRRINRLGFHLDMPPGDDVAIFGDGSGFQAIVGGEYLREKYGKKNRRWVQVIIFGRPDTKDIVDFKINLIPQSEAGTAKEWIREKCRKGEMISSFGGDGAFDDIKLWSLLENKKIRAVIKPDSNARTDSDSPLRNSNVKERNRAGYKEWARAHRYGMRWPATEGIFSAVKRIFGEQLSARSELGLLQEARSKLWMYQAMKKYGES